jgi:hypothetical protein
MGNLDIRGIPFVGLAPLADVVIAADTGVKTSSFNGATQTNSWARGAVITILLGAVTGTNPTLSAQLQWSPDSGQTWINYGASLGNLTASNQTGVILIHPDNLSTAGASPAALGVGSTVSAQMNAPLPKTWRINYVLGGTSPSFTVSNVQVTYLASVS